MCSFSSFNPLKKINKTWPNTCDIKKNNYVINIHAKLLILTGWGTFLPAFCETVTVKMWLLRKGIPWPHVYHPIVTSTGGRVTTLLQVHEDAQKTVWSIKVCFACAENSNFNSNSNNAWKAYWNPPERPQCDSRTVTQIHDLFYFVCNLFLLLLFLTCSYCYRQGRQPGHSRGSKYRDVFNGVRHRS